MTIHGLIIDPQIDFCDPAGALFVPGADADMARLAALLERIAGEVDALHVSLDAHHFADIAHPAWWRDADGNPPSPFTIITADEIAAGRWTTARLDALPRSRAYVEALARQGRYPLCIWPPHCLLGSPGQAVVPALHRVLCAWETDHGPVDYVVKGVNAWTEHYSALQADVPDPTDPSTQVNAALLAALHGADRIFVAGEAGSHCVAHTVRDIAEAPGGDALLRKMTLLTDAVSPVPGFAPLQERFLADLAARGLRLSATAEFLR